MLCMAEAEIKVLGQKLSEILGTLSVSDENRIIVRKFQATGEATRGSREYKEAVERVNRELARWMKAHQVANKYGLSIGFGVGYFFFFRWIEDLKNFMHLLITIKYLYLGVHCSLVVIGLSGLVLRLCRAT